MLVVALVSIGTSVFAQTIRLSGKVLSEKNEPLAGVSVKIVGTPGGTSTNIEGRFTLNLTAGKKYELEFSAIGYESKSLTDVEVGNGQSNDLSIVLNIKSKTGENVVLTTRSSARKETAASIISFQKNTNTVASVISAESIRRSPDKNTGEVLKRTPGASLQEGKFIIIRGLADRYNQAMLNGILLTSTEPDRKTFSFDLIPASMIDNIIINKAFVPEYPGEWAGGLIQVNTKDIPNKNFFNVQVGTGFNSQTIGQDFYKDKVGGKTDWLGFDDGTRALPASYTRKAEFDILTPEQKTAIGKQLRNSWAPVQVSAPTNVGVQVNGGFTTKFLGKNVGGTLGISYSKTNRILELVNRSNSLSGNVFSVNYDYNDKRFLQDVSVGVLGSFTVQLNALNKISVKSILNVNSPNAVTKRTGTDFNRGDDIRATELSFKQNTFFTVQVNGEHSITKPIKLKWYGSFNILDGYIPDQRRIAYATEAGTQNPYRLLISNTLSQQSGSRIYQNLSDYIYTAGGDLTYTFNWLKQKQTLKGGYMLQVKDRLYDAQLFANYLPIDNPVLRLLPADQVFAPENFGNGSGNKLAFDAIKGKTFRYLANTILNGAFIQMDNQFTRNLRVVWGLRVENYDQLVGSVKKWDPRHTHSVATDILPGLNATLKLDNKTNIRLSGSQTVIRPELRELSFLNIYDFELNASVQGNPNLKRTNVRNFDLRYEFYPKAGEVLTAGVFYKFFKNPIEQLFNEGSGGASTFSYQNPQEASAFGAEVELRKKLDFAEHLKNFTFQANASYIKSNVKDQGFSIDRPMQGQSPYVVNMGILYDLEKSGLSATVLFNRIGERIYLVGDLTSGAGSPDIYEAPRTLLDFQMSKKLIKNKAEIRLNISDILNSTQYFYQNSDGNKKLQKGVDAYRFTRQAGTNFNITFNYSL